MFRFTRISFLVLSLFAAAASTVAAQGNPTGTICGVVDPDGLPLPGVTVTASSDALQGVRTAVTSDHGDFMIPFLPPGVYLVICEPIWDRSRGQARFNSPTFCAVCGSGWLEHRDN